MIRVLQVLHGMDCGGAETMIMNLYRHIDRTKIQFDFLVHTKKKCYFDDEIRQMGGNIYYAPHYNILNDILYKKSLNNFFKNHSEIRIVHGHLNSCAHVYLKIAKNYGCYAIAHSHSVQPYSMFLKNLLYKFFSSKTRQFADFFFGCSNAAVEYCYGKKILESSKSLVLKNAIDTRKFIYSNDQRKKIREEFSFHNEFVVGHIGRMDEAKNQSFVIDVFKEIHDRKESSQLILVGDGELRKRLESKVKSLGLEKNVIFTGVRSDVSALLSAMDVFVFPSLYEGLGIVAVEAQTSGLPTYCSCEIPEDAKISVLFEKISLKEPSSYWAEKILEKNEICNREEKYLDAENAGYDIRSTAKWLEDFYAEI